MKVYTNNYELLECTQESLMVKKSVENKLSDVKTTTDYKVFLDTLQPGDILSSYGIGTKDTKLKTRLFYKLMAIFQRTGYNSIKFFIKENAIGGYIGKFEEETNSFVSRFRILRMEEFNNLVSKVLILRHKNIKKYHARLLLNEALKRKNIDYDSKGLLNSIIERTLHINMFEDPLEIEKLSKEDAKQLVDPTICSSVIYVIYKAAGLDIRMNGVKLVQNIWPVDFILSQDIEPVLIYQGADK